MLPALYFSVFHRIPYFASIYELGRKQKKFERLSSINKSLTDSAEIANIPLNHTNSHEMLKYTRNQSCIDRRISPTLYDILLSAKGVLGDDYAQEVLYLAMSYFFPLDKTGKSKNCDFYRVFHC
ncbi:MAG: hypothetical protein HQM08_07215 [Candidatus Riflebacteria bacterium]|nr:hypothetical protein [Candidatus Riflebacteria bacterium]